MKRWHRHTIMDGRVVTFVEDAELLQDQVLGPNYKTLGPYEVSASRNAVVVHRANLKNSEVCEKFIRAVKAAHEEMLFLKQCDGRPDDENHRELAEV